MSTTTKQRPLTYRTALKAYVALYPQYADHADQYVAIVLDDNGRPTDATYNWETAQNYALYGNQVIAIKGDGSYWTRTKIQSLCDSEYARFRDCYGLDRA